MRKFSVFTSKAAKEYPRIENLGFFSLLLPASVEKQRTHIKIFTRGRLTYQSPNLLIGEVNLKLMRYWFILLLVPE
uniref:Uncharacterized protein n=1 Tax=Arundo donax TaxID=35708 RepID=A0A0A9GHR8_ARUDO